MYMIVFFEIIKRNAILYSIIMNGGISQLDFADKNITVWSEKAIEFRNIPCGEDLFESVVIVDADSFISMDFKTSDPKFFLISELFFGKKGSERLKEPFIWNNTLVEEEFKELDTFHAFDRNVAITIRKSNVFGYTISLRLYSDVNNVLSKKTYSIKNKDVPQEILYLFKPNEVILIPKYSPFNYAPKIEISVKSPDHPVLKYYENRSWLSVNNKLYEHGKVPKINSFTVSGLTFLQKSDIDEDKTQRESVLIVNLGFPSKNNSSLIEGKLSYEVLQPTIEYFKVGNKIFTKNDLELATVNLDKVYFLEKTLFGKEAVDEFHDPKYAQGISIYKKK
jgi:hypothetical protein